MGHKKDLKRALKLKRQILTDLSRETDPMIREMYKNWYKGAPSLLGPSLKQQLEKEKRDAGK